MVALVRTVAYLGLEARSVEVQCQVAPVPRPAPFGEHGSAHRRRTEGAPGRGQPCASGRAVPRRTARIPAPGARFAAPAARDRASRCRPRQCPCHLPGPRAAGRRNEPVPLRLCRRSGAELQQVPALYRRLSGALVRPLVRPDRSSRPCRRGERARHDAAPAGRGQRRGGRPGRRCPRAAGAARRALQCRTGRRTAQDPCHPRRGGPQDAFASRREAAPIPRASIQECCGWRARSPIWRAPRQ